MKTKIISIDFQKDFTTEFYEGPTFVLDSCEHLAEPKKNGPQEVS